MCMSTTKHYQLSSTTESIIHLLIIINEGADIKLHDIIKTTTVIPTTTIILHHHRRTMPNTIAVVILQHHLNSDTLIINVCL